MHLLCAHTLCSDTFDRFAAENEQKVVRVGWYESPFNSTGADGSRSGYAYEYQQKIAAYTGWKCEYVEGSWVELLQMVQNGELDLMTDVSYTEERAETMLYSELPMGAENYYLYVAGGNTSITPQNLSTLNGKKVGVNEGSFQCMLLNNWREEKDLSFNIIETALGEAESWQLVLDGKLDGYVSLDSYSGNGDMICKIGYSDFYFVMNNECEELMTELNAALDSIQSENRNYNQQLWDKYLGNQGASRYLTANEVNWLSEHGTIRVGYRDNYLPFSGTDSATGEAAGFLKDYLDTASTLFRNAEIDFELVAYPNTQEAKEALLNGEIDCVFPLSLSLSDAENEGLLVSNAVVESQMDLIVSKKISSDINPSDSIRFAVNDGNVSYVKVLNEYFPDCEIVYFADTQSCFKGIADGKADGILVSSHRVSTVSKTMDKYQLVALDTSVSTECNFSMKAGNVYLYSILNKVQNLIPDATVQNMILQNTRVDTTVMFSDFLKDNLAQVLIACAVIAAALVFLLLKSRKAEKTAKIAEERTAKVNTEIQEVNAQLEERQAQLEESTAEQEAQLEDITALNAELETARAAADAANNAKTSFLFNMSHDIRTPMNAIMGFRDLLEKHQEEPEKRADYLKKIEDSSKFLLSIINNILEMARIEKGKMELDETAWSAEQFSDTLWAVFEEMMSQKGLQFTCSVDVQHPYVYCDPIKLREVFFNILSNAYKYTNAGGSVSMHVEEISSDREGYAMYRSTITDTGIGMSEEFLPHIFEEFARERNTTDNKIEGTGLGMPIVKRLIELMDGSIEIRSEKGVGSTFIVTLPHKIAERSSLVNHAGVEIDPALFEGKRILLAEDNDLNAEIAMEILGEAGFIVDRAEDGVICCEKITYAENNIYDLILMDVQMPNMNGYDATRVIRQMEDTAKANIPIISMTANAFEEDRREALRAGMNGHLAKPINVKELMKALAGILG